VLFQAVFVQLRAATMTAILHPLAPLLDDVLVGQSLEIGINVVGINVHRIGIVKTRGRARSRRQIITGSACLALVVLQVNRVAVGLERGVVFCHNQEVRKPIDVIGVESLLETIKQILIRLTGARGSGLEIGHKFTKCALALLHPNDLILCVGLGTDRLEL
jgi:hypothetical protein